MTEIHKKLETFSESMLPSKGQICQRCQRGKVGTCHHSWDQKWNLTQRRNLFSSLLPSPDTAVSIRDNSFSTSAVLQESKVLFWFCTTSMQTVRTALIGRISPRCLLHYWHQWHYFLFSMPAKYVLPFTAYKCRSFHTGKYLRTKTCSAHLGTVCKFF